ncbi:MAG TPA: tetratricopeptide repeat protein, partial [Nitrososphaeraceae archaeon]|nr:tetratricopeptide repeat protein [Nitrososphaeraceae archaeon]
MKLFISYSRDDAGDFAKHVHRYFISRKYHVFIDINSIRAGDPWADSIEKNISDCDIFIVILTPDSLLSSHVEKEVLQAQRNNKIIIPCVNEDVEYNEIKWTLNDIQGVEFSDRYELVRKLYSKIKNYDTSANTKINDSNSLLNPLYGNEYLAKADSPAITSAAHSSQKYLDKAKEWENVDENEKALKQYENAIKEEPENFLVRCELSFFLERIGKTNEALEAIEQAIDLKPTNSEVWYHKARILEKLEKYEEAIVALTKDLKLDSKDIKSWTSKAKLLVKMEKYEEALDAIYEITNIDSANIDAFEKKGKILEQLKQYKEAINCYDKILEIQPDNHAILISKGHVLQKLDKYQEAIECYDKVLNSKPENLEVRIERCITIAKSSRYQEAVECYDEIIQLNPDNKLLWINKGDILYKNLKQYNEAIECYDKVLQLDPDDPDSKKNRESALYELEKEKFAHLINEANSYYENKNYTKVIELCDKAIDIDKENHKPYLYKAKSLQHLSRYEEAVACYYKVLAIDKNNEEAIKNKKITIEILNKERFTSLINEIKKCYENKDYSTVIRLSDDASVIYPNDPLSYLYKGHALQELTRYEEAIQAYDDVLRIDPKNADALNKRKIIQEQLDKRSDKQKETIQETKISDNVYTVNDKRHHEDVKYMNTNVGQLPNDDHSIKVASETDGKIIRLWDQKPFSITLEGHTDKVTSVAISPDNTKVVSGSDDKTIKIWDLKSGELLNTLVGHKSYICSIAISSDNTKVVSGGGWWDKKIKIWDLDSGELLNTLVGHINKISSVAISPDSSKIVSGGIEGKIKIWDLDSGELLNTLDLGSLEMVLSIAITPDSSKIVSGLHYHQIYIWDLDSGELLNSFFGHAEEINSVAITP